MASYDGFVSTLLWVLFVIQVIEVNPSDASTNISCIGVEREALLKFKHSLIDSSRRLLSWTGEECCEWKGVECNEKTGHVLKLDLRGTCIEEFVDIYEVSTMCWMLEGNIDPSLIELKYLKYLDLSLGNFSTQKIPTFFASLQNLEYLNLSSPNFEGEIPKQLSNLSKLQYLDLSSRLFPNYLTSNNLDWVSKLTSLKYLHMSGVNLSKVKDWFNSINMLPSLQSLDLSNCELNDISNYLPGNLTSLRFLDISSNIINSSMPPWICNLSKLEHVDMSSNFLQGEFPKNLSSLCKLQVVQFSEDQLNGNISIILDGSLGCVPSNWKIFHISFNNFSGDLPNQFRYFKKLEDLDLSGDSISGSIPLNLVELPYLRKLSLSTNKLSGTIPESIGRLSNLRELNLGYNFLYGVIGELHFENLKSLTTLAISFNQLIFNVSSTWVPPFQALEIYLSNCKVGPEFPRWVQTQRYIFTLEMSNASISDSIPNWLYSSSSNIRVLDISRNMLRGQVPQDIGNKMPRLTNFILWGNNLTGGIPSSLCKLKMVIEISLSKNQLSGRLPRCWGALERLYVISFGDNKLNGQIPESLCPIQYLGVLCLQKNDFSGVIPSCLSNLRMEILDLSDNEITGRLPPFGKHSQSLRVINLEKNHLIGGIPSQLCQLIHLQFLSLAQNNVTGPIPNCFDGFLPMVDDVHRSVSWPGHDEIEVMVNTKGTSQIYKDLLPFFYSIDLSANMLDGQIPEEFTKLVLIRNLNLSRNNLRGQIPSNIGDLKNLESLDLFKNKLSGTIPPSISNIDFLSRFNLSFNRLSGPIPSGNHLHTVDDESVYRGNNGLCGAPLSKICHEDEPPHTDVDNSSGDKPSEGHSDIHNWFYAGMGPGFTMGFLGFCSTLHFKRSWRIFYFRVMDKAIEKFSMTTMIIMLWFKRTFRQSK